MSRDQENSEGPANKPSEIKLPKSFVKDVSGDVKRQVKLSCDSLAVLLQKSKFCQLKKMKSKTPDTDKKSANTPQTPVQILLPSEERTVEYFTKGETDSFTISQYLRSSQKNMKYLQKTKSYLSGENFLCNTNLCGGSDILHWGFDDFKSWSLAESEEIGRLDGSGLGVRSHEKTETKRLINAIQKELINLMEMVPSVAKTVHGLIETLSHYKECDRCKEKIKPVLPWILGRIQKLSKFIILKRGLSINWKNEHSHFRLIKSGSPRDSLKVNVSNVGQKPSIRLGRLQRVEAGSVSGAVPGIQLQLEVKPALPQKKFLLNAKNVKVVNTARKLHPRVEFKEPQASPLVQVLKAEQKKRLHLNKKRQVVFPKALNLFTRVRFISPNTDVIVYSIFQIKPKSLTLEDISLKSSLSQYELCSEGTQEDSQTDFVKALNDKVTTGKIKFLTIPEVVRSLLSDSQAIMQVEKVKELEVEVKGLKDLMLEVHKNQIDLNKLMVEKGLSTQNVSEVSDSDKAVEKANSVSEGKHSSQETLQIAVDNLKKKCDVKNKMIVTLLKGIQKDVPNEWWEQLVDYVFDETKTGDEFDSEKAKNFLQQTSVYLVQDNGASKSLTPSRNEDNSSEEFKKKNAIRCTFTTTTTTTTTKRNYISASPHFDSDIVTKIEEFPDNKIKPRITPAITNEADVPRTPSSFVRKVLNKDIIDGSTVGELFETLKKAKTNINLLSESNNEILKKLTCLQETLKTSAKEMKNKEGDLKKFIRKISEDEKTWVFRIDQENSKPITCFPKPKIKFPEEVHPHTSSTQFTEQKFKKKRSTSNTKPESCHEGNSLQVCEKDPKRALLKDRGPRNRSGMKITLEGVLGAFLASSLELERNHFFSNDLPHIYKLMRSEMVKQCRESLNIQKSGGDLSLTDASMQIISHICESFAKSSDQSQDSAEETENGSDEDLDDLDIWHSQTNIIPDQFEFCVEESEEDKEDDASETDSMFEEALSEPFPLRVSDPYLKTAKRERSSIKLPDQTDDSLSWINKLKEDIKSRIVSLKEKVYVGEDPKQNEKSFENSNFVITANSPVGLFDLTLRQFKGKGNIVEFDYNKVPAFTVAPVTKIIPGKSSRDSADNEFVITIPKAKIERRTSIKENLLSTSELTKKPSFFEIIVCTPVCFVHEVIKKSAICRKNTDSNEKKLKTHSVSKKPSFFEIIVCTPKCFAQEVIQKTAVPGSSNDCGESCSSTENVNGNYNERSALDLLTENGFFLNTVDFARGSDYNPRILIQDSSNEYVIYIQVEEENVSKTPVCGENSDETEQDPKNLPNEKSGPSNDVNNNSSKGASSHQNKDGIFNQPSGTKQLVNQITQSDELPLKIIKKIQTTSTLSSTDIGKEIQKIMKSKIPFLINGEVDTILSDGMRKKTDTNQNPEQEGLAKESKLKSVKFTDEFTEVAEEKEIRQLFPETEAPLGNAVEWIPLDNVLQAEVLHPQTEFLKVNTIEKRKSGQQVLIVYEAFETGGPELDGALKLIHQLEHDVHEVKLRDAILLLPRLESELRRHLQGKIKGMKSRCSVVHSSVENFFSAVDFWPDSIQEDRRDDSEERLENLLCLLSHLEEAVKADEFSRDRMGLCSFDSSRVYELLHALTNSIRELEQKATVVSLAETLEIASQLDNAVREYDCNVKKEPKEYKRQEMNELKEVKEAKEVKEIKEIKKPKCDEKGDDWGGGESVVTNHLKNVRKKVFEIVEGEAEEVEERIEKDFDRVDRLERQNEEALRFIEAFLEKTQRRAGELESAKTNLKELSSTLDEMCSIMETVNQIKKNESLSKMIKTEEKQSEKTATKAVGPKKAEASVKAEQKPVSSVKVEPSEKPVSSMRAEPYAKTIIPTKPEPFVKPLTTNKTEPFVKAEPFVKPITTMKTEHYMTPVTTMKTELRVKPGMFTKAEPYVKPVTNTNTETYLTPATSMKAESYMKPGALTKADPYVNVVTTKNTELYLTPATSMKAEYMMPETITNAELSTKPTASAKTEPSVKSVAPTKTETVKPIVSTKTEPSMKPVGNSVKTEPSIKTIVPVKANIPAKTVEAENEKDLKSCSHPTVKDTVSGLILALEKLKTKARQKNKVCMEILGARTFESYTPKSSRCSFTSRNSDVLSVIKEVKQIGHNSLYLTWGQPDNIDLDSLQGYEILVNGKLQQKVRNPKRLQAVLYSVAAQGRLDIQLYAVVENNKILVGTTNY